jgi:hypothetical protein
MAKTPGPFTLITTTIRLSRPHTLWLSQSALTIIKPSGASMNRSSFLRAVIDGLAAAPLDFSHCSNPSQVRRTIEWALSSRLRTKADGDEQDGGGL